MDRSLLDTDIFSEITKGVDEHVVAMADAYLREHAKLSISVVTVFEVTKGLSKAGREDALQRFVASLASMEVLTMTPHIATLAGRICADLERTGQPIGHIDPIVAATALSHGLVLVTGNRVHFERILKLGFNLRLDNWRLA